MRSGPPILLGSIMDVTDEQKEKIAQAAEEITEHTRIDESKYSDGYLDGMIRILNELDIKDPDVAAIYNDLRTDLKE